MRGVVPYERDLSEGLPRPIFPTGGGKARLRTRLSKSRSLLRSDHTQVTRGQRGWQRQSGNLLVGSDRRKINEREMKKLEVNARPRAERLRDQQEGLGLRRLSGQ